MSRPGAGMPINHQPRTTKSIASAVLVPILAGSAVVHAGGVHALAPVPAMVLCLVVCGAVLSGTLFATNSAASRQHTTRCVAAVLLAATGAWSSLVWSCDSFSLTGTVPPSQWTTWRLSHQVSRTHFDTFMVAGWPLQGVEGHGGGGGPEKLLWGKGLGVMHANFLAWLALSSALAWLLERRGVSLLCWLAFLAAPLAVAVGCYRLLGMLD